MQGYFVTVNELYSAQYPTKFWYVPLFLLLRDWVIGVSVLFVVVDFSEPILTHVLSIKACKWHVPLLLTMYLVVCIGLK